jgi:hypothetical protein
VYRLEQAIHELNVPQDNIPAYRLDICIDSSFVEITTIYNYIYVKKYTIINNLRPYTKKQMGSLELYHKQIMKTTNVSGTWRYDHK